MDSKKSLRLAMLEILDILYDLHLSYIKKTSISSHLVSIYFYYQLKNIDPIEEKESAYGSFRYDLLHSIIIIG